MPPMIIPVIWDTNAPAIDDDTKPVIIAETIWITNPIMVTIIAMIRAQAFPFKSP